MRDHEYEAMAADDLRAGLRVSAVSVGWTGSSSAASVALGVDAHSLVLIAFGLAGLLDAVGSAALVAHFRHALRHEAFSARHEHLALRVVTIGLLAVGALTAVESLRRLVGGTQSHAAPAGLVLAALSIGVLALLSHRKRQIAGRIPSRALLADGWLSATGCLLAVVTVAGTGFTSAFGWWWVDPVAASAVGCGAMGVAMAMTR